MCDLVENYANEKAAEAAEKADKEATEKAAKEAAEIASKEAAEKANSAKKLFENGVSYDIVRASIISISDEDLKSFVKEIGTGATPTVIFYKKGEEKSVATRIVGSVSEEKIISKFKDNGIIK